MVGGMATELFTEYHVNLRTILGDFGREGVYKYKAESLTGALMSVVQMGLGPKGVAVSGDKTGLDPAPSSADARGYLVIQAAISILSGGIPVSIKTRALQTRVDPLERMTSLDGLRRLLKRIETTGDPHGTGGSRCFGVWQDFENEVVRSANDPEQVY
jgi:hypothetical protein